MRYDNLNYTSGPLPFDQGNPAEDPPHGLWGIGSPSYVGGHVQILWQAGGPSSSLQGQWTDICYDYLTVPVQPRAWGSVKSLYR